MGLLLRILLVTNAYVGPGTPLAYAFDMSNLWVILLPFQSTTADFTKLTQVIPVKITLQGYQGIGLTPGMSATVKIHK